MVDSPTSKTPFRSSITPSCSSRLACSPSRSAIFASQFDQYFVGFTCHRKQVSHVCHHILRENSTAQARVRIGSPEVADSLC